MEISLEPGFKSKSKEPYTSCNNKARKRTCFVLHIGTLQYITKCRVCIVPHIQMENFHGKKHTSGHCVLMPRAHKCAVTKKGRESLPERCRHLSYKPYKKTILLQTNAKRNQYSLAGSVGMNSGNRALWRIACQRLPLALEGL